MLKLQLPRPAGKQPAAAQPQPERPQVPLLETDPTKGLTAEQAAQRMAAGLDNHAAASPTRSETEIIRDNIFTFFNLVFIVLALCLALVGSFANMTFLGVVIANTIIGTVQQLRSKRTVDQLTLVAAHKVRCLRDGKSILLPSEELVRDDIVEFTSGEQICADAVVCTGSAQANEALITGEAEPVPKNVGDVLRSGSFLVSGRCTVRLTHVGAESYASKLATEAREGGHKVAKGEMMRSLDGLIRVIGIALIPMGVVMFLKQYVSLELPLRDSVEATVAALIGMIPEGLYLLTSVALAVSMVRLAQRKVLAQDMNCIETLARVDVLCVDKTGTITEARMEAGEPLLLTPDAWPQDRVYTVLHSIYAGTEPDNDTARAMVQRFGKQNGTPWPRQSVVPFNSAYKWSAATFAEGSFVVGAPEFVAGARYAELAAQVEPLLEKGSRVLLLARCDAEPDPKVGLDADKLEFVALLPVANRIRPEAPETFRYFAEQGVAVKVISGDNPVAVSEVARQAGIEGAERYVDAATLDTDEKSCRSRAHLHGVWPCNPRPEAQIRESIASGWPHRCDDGRRRERCAGPEGCGLRYCHGIRCPGRQPGGPAGTAGIGFFRPACRCGGGPPRDQQHSAVGIAVFGQEYFLVPAYLYRAVHYHAVSAAAAAAFAAVDGHHRHPVLYSGAGAQPRDGARQIHPECSARGPARRFERPAAHFGYRSLCVRI